jgi:cytochrome c oxidase subunit III
MLLGIGFLVGVVGVEWQLAPFGPGDGAGRRDLLYDDRHARLPRAHRRDLPVYRLRNGLRGKYTAERHWGVEAAANYWHFVDVVWIFFYPALYLIGTVSGG